MSASVSTEDWRHMFMHDARSSYVPAEAKVERKRAPEEQKSDARSSNFSHKRQRVQLEQIPPGFREYEQLGKSHAQDASVISGTQHNPIYLDWEAAYPSRMSTQQPPVSYDQYWAFQQASMQYRTSTPQNVNFHQHEQPGAAHPGREYQGRGHAGNAQQTHAHPNYVQHIQTYPDYTQHSYGPASYTHPGFKLFEYTQPYCPQPVYTSSANMQPHHASTDPRQPEYVQMQYTPPAPAEAPRQLPAVRRIYEPVVEKQASKNRQRSRNLDHEDADKRKRQTAPPKETDDALDCIVPITEPSLCEEQEKLVKVILSGQNVFYTGSAGCGKSTVLKSFVGQLRALGKQVDIIAPTGRAALAINGTTTWTYAGWTPNSHKKPLADLVKDARGNKAFERLRGTNVLVIDEISMVENLHFERLNAIMKEARDNKRAFGGVQLIVTGDFCQLPPVKPFRHCIECGRDLKEDRMRRTYTCPQRHAQWHDRDKWAFRSRAWKECKFENWNLTTIHRQSDANFIGILQRLRLGKRLVPEDVHLLLNHKSQTRGAVKLFGRREQVNKVNDEMFTKLRSKAHAWKCLDSFRHNSAHVELASKGDREEDGTLVELNKNEHRYEKNVQLKKGMLVVLQANIDISAGLVNGSQGTIQGFVAFSKATTPKVARRKDNQPAIGPVLTGDYAEYRETCIHDFMKNAEYQYWPSVQFLGHTEPVTVYADCTVNEIGDYPFSLISRTQIPLAAGYAITTHKSQGMTLNRVEVDLSATFEAGQAYVALSRARSLDGLTLTSFPESAQRPANFQVREFLQQTFEPDETPN